jgi:hypothetical protein
VFIFILLRIRVRSTVRLETWFRDFLFPAPPPLTFAIYVNSPGVDGRQDQRDVLEVELGADQSLFSVHFCTGD